MSQLIAPSSPLPSSIKIIDHRSSSPVRVRDYANVKWERRQRIELDEANVALNTFNYK